MEYVPKHTTENHFLMVKSWWFVMVFVVETITIFCDGFIGGGGGSVGTSLLSYTVELWLLCDKHESPPSLVPPKK